MASCFFAGPQIEFQEEAGRFVFESEHLLGTKPKQIDVLIIKKEKDYRVQKNIGRIFRKYNIIEYKSPSDYLGVNDFYQTYGYACFYKADTVEEDSILITEVTLTFVCSHYPRVVLRHLEKVRGYTIHQEEEGIYYIEGDIMPIQIIVTARLSSGRNLWLRSLTNRLDHMKDARQLVSEYKAYKNNTLYQSVMNLIVRANKEKFEEVKEMCDALMELMKDEFEELKKESIAEGRAEGQELNLISLIQRKVRKHKPLEVIARELEAGIDSIRDVYEMVKSNPLAGEEDIYKRLHSAK